jgi:hypothetical protein
MMTKTLSLSVAAIALALGGCMTTPRAGPVEVTRFHAAEMTARLGQGTVFVETAPGMDGTSLALAPFKAAVARELVRLGYREAPREQADQIAQVRLEQVVETDDARRRGPVSVGVGGSTGSYGSGLGLGIGINLGGNRSREAQTTRLGVMIRDKASGATYWEGRAQFSVSPDSPLAASEANAQAVASALLQEFPGTNGATVQVKVPE